LTDLNPGLLALSCWARLALRGRDPSESCRAVPCRAKTDTLPDAFSKLSSLRGCWGRQNAAGWVGMEGLMPGGRMEDMWRDRVWRARHQRGGECGIEVLGALDGHGCRGRVPYSTAQYCMSPCTSYTEGSSSLKDPGKVAYALPVQPQISRTDDSAAAPREE